MKSGDIFKVDAAALQELADLGNTTVADIEKKVADGDTFSISKKDSCKGAVIFASKWENGKPKRGRPRRFPRATVQRLLGEPLTEAEETEPTKAATPVQAPAEPEVDTDALEERAAALLAAPATAAVADAEDDDDEW